MKHTVMLNLRPYDLDIIGRVDSTIFYNVSAGSETVNRKAVIRSKYGNESFIAKFADGKTSKIHLDEFFGDPDIVDHYAPIFDDCGACPNKGTFCRNQCEETVETYLF